MTDGVCGYQSTDERLSMSEPQSLTVRITRPREEAPPPHREGRVRCSTAGVGQRARDPPKRRDRCSSVKHAATLLAPSACKWVSDMIGIFSERSSERHKDTSPMLLYGRHHKNVVGLDVAMGTQSRGMPATNYVTSDPQKTLSVPNNKNQEFFFTLDLASNLTEYSNEFNSKLLFSLNTSDNVLSSTIQPNINDSLSDWGPKRDPLYIVIPITIIYVLILFTGLVGNICTCIVIFRNRSMHTATNFYLFSLAISDLLLLLSGLPNEIYSTWSRYPYVFGETFCVLQGLAAETSANATVLTITAFTVERYVAICHPFLSHTLSKLSRAVRLVIILWATALCFAIPQALEFGVVYEKLPNGNNHPEHVMCGVKRVLLPHAFEVSTVIFFIFPMTLITVLYVLIGIRLYKSSSSISTPSPFSNENGGPNNLHDPAGLRDSRKNYPRHAQTTATKHVVKMLAPYVLPVAVVAAFFICWAPFHAQRLLAIHGYSTEGETSPGVVALYYALTYVSGVLYYLSTTVNPVLYHIMSNKFRDAFKDTLARCVGKRGGVRGQRRLYSGLSRSSRTVPDTTDSSTCCREDSFMGPRRANSLRYLEADVARQGQRPLVVSFRRPHVAMIPSPSAATVPSDVRVYVSVEAGGRSRPAAYLSVLYRTPSDVSTRITTCPMHEIGNT
ncbi:hypothetical protein B566_EDAN003970 [Ephemera danica]|nr:hypothetical protein B566_EDAN003970 [Ephemera danica]